MADAGHTLSVDRWRNEYLIPASHPAPHRLQQDLDAAVARNVAPAIGAATAYLLPDDSDDVIFVRRLEVECMLDAAWDRDAVARATASALTRALSHALAIDNSGNVVRFRSAADHRAAYVVARAGRTGPLPWFFRRFEGFAVLPTSAAIRSALVADADDGRAALACLMPAALADVADALTERDAERIVDALATPVSGGGHAFAEVLAVTRAVAGACPPRRVLDFPGLAVWLLAARAPHAAAWPVLTSARIIRALHSASGRPGMPPLESLLAAACEDQRTLAQAAVLSTRGRDEFDRFARALAASVQASAPAAAAVTHRSTRNGGLFLLLDDLFALDLDDVTRTWPTLCETPALNILQLTVLAWSASDPVAVLRDPLWRDLFRWSGSIAPDDIAAWLEEQAERATLLDEYAHRLLHRFARRLPGFCSSGADYMRANFLDAAAAIDADPERIVVTLSRVPLHLVLTMAGLNRSERRWPSLDERPFVLLQGD